MFQNRKYYKETIKNIEVREVKKKELENEKITIKTRKKK